MLARVIGTIVILLVLFAIISDPQDAAANTRQGASTLADAGTSVTVFLSNVVNDLAGTSSSSSGSRYYPSGGIETGDGSTPTLR